MATEAPVNGVGTTLSAAITSTSATTCSLTSATGFTNAQYHCLITDGTNYEIVLATALSGTTLTITRAVEAYNGTQTAYTFASGSTITVVQSVASVTAVAQQVANSSYQTILENATYTVAAAGSNVGTATALNFGVNYVTGATATANNGAGTGVYLPNPTVFGQQVTVVNNTVHWLLVYLGSAGTLTVDNANPVANFWIPPNQTWGGTATTTGASGNYDTIVLPIVSNGAPITYANSAGTAQGVITLGTVPTSLGGTNLTGFTAANNALYSTSSSVLAAGTLPIAAGGTALTAVGTAGQVIAANPGATALEYRTLAVGTPATATQATTSLTASSANIVSGSLFQLPTSDLAVGSRFKFTICIAKTGAGSATWTLTVKYGTAGTTSDAAIATWTSGTNTAAIDSALLEITVNILTTGSSGTANCLAFYRNALTSSTGLGSIAGTPGSTATLNTTSTTPYFHVDITPGSSAVMTAWCAAERLA